MTQSPEQRLAHICILVRNIDQAIGHYRRILSAVSPQLLKAEVKKEEQFAGKDRYVTAFFPAPGAGCDIQLLQPLDPESPLYKRLEKHGEGLHHICLYVDDIESKLAELEKVGIRLIDKTPRMGAEGHRIAFVHPSDTHGVLIELEER